jgi:hypothetical protein
VDDKQPDGPSWGQQDDNSGREQLDYRAAIIRREEWAQK